MGCRGDTGDGLSPKQYILAPCTGDFEVQKKHQPAFVSVHGHELIFNQLVTNQYIGAAFQLLIL